MKNYGQTMPTCILRIDAEYAGQCDDVVKITLPNMPNPDGGVGVVDMLGQIWERGEKVFDGTSELKIMLVGWNQ